MQFLKDVFCNTFYFSRRSNEHSRAFFYQVSFITQYEYLQNLSLSLWCKTLPSRTKYTHNLFTVLETLVFPLVSLSLSCRQFNGGKKEQLDGQKWKRNGMLITVYTGKDNYQLKTNFRGIFCLRMEFTVSLRRLVTMPSAICKTFLINYRQDSIPSSLPY